MATVTTSKPPLTVAQLNTMTPQQRAAYYVANLTAAQKRGPLTSTQTAELAKYQLVAAGKNPVATTPKVPISGTPGAGTSGGAATPLPNNAPPSTTPWGAPIDLRLPSTDTYTLAEQWYYAIKNPGAAPANSIFSQAGNPGPTLSNGGQTGTYGQFQLGQLLGGIVGAGEQYFPTSVYPAIPQSVFAAGGLSTQVAFGAASGATQKQGTYTPRQDATLIGTTVAPAGGNASSLVPSATTTSPVTSQGTGTATATAPTDTGTTGAATSGASTATGAGGGFDFGGTGTAVPSSGGMTTSDLILIGIGAAGLLLAMHKRKG